MLAAQTYLSVLDGASVDAVGRSVQQFITGAVSWHDGRFVPSAAELARNVRQWEDAIRTVEEARSPKQLASGILSVDFGGGRIDMTKLTVEQQDEVLRTGKAPAVAHGPTMARLRRMSDRERGYSVGDDAEDAA